MKGLIAPRRRANSIGSTVLFGFRTARVISSDRGRGVVWGVRFLIAVLSVFGAMVFFTLTSFRLLARTVVRPKSLSKCTSRRLERGPSERSPDGHSKPSLKRLRNKLPVPIVWSGSLNLDPVWLQKILKAYSLHSLSPT